MKISANEVSTLTERILLVLRSATLYGVRTLYLALMAAASNNG
jgi:hypothetical protein